MNTEAVVKVVDECAFCRPEGESTLEDAVMLVERAIVYARENKIPKLFFNGLQLNGIRSPSLPERYFISRQFATVAEGKVQMALVVHPHLIDPERFGIKVARNAGMNADVFDNESDALAWLLLKTGD